MEKVLLVLALSVAAASAAGIFFIPKDEPNLKLGSLLSPDYNQAEVARNLARWKAGKDPRNIWELGGLREGDIIDPVGVGRNVIKDAKYNWPNFTVVYKYEPGMRRNEKIEIKKGMGIITNGTCIKFREATAKDKDYIYIMHSSTVCNSYVGKQNGSQVVNIGRGYCFQYAVIAHEFLHAIGLDHQHNTFNRDDYVYVNFSNVEKDEWHNFDKDSQDEYTDYGLPYDYNSVMHYGRYAFTKFKDYDPSWGSDHYSIIPDDETADIGQQHYVSQIDYLKVNLKYKCPGYEGTHFVINPDTWQVISES